MENFEGERPKSPQQEQELSPEQLERAREAMVEHLEGNKPPEEITKEVGEGVVKSHFNRAKLAGALAIGLFFGGLEYKYIFENGKVAEELQREGARPEVSQVTKTPEKIPEKINQQKLLEEAQKRQAEELRRAAERERARQEAQKSPEVVVKNFEEAYDEYVRVFNETDHELQMAIPRRGEKRGQRNPAYPEDLWLKVWTRYKTATVALYESCNDVKKRWAENLPEETSRRASYIKRALETEFEVYDKDRKQVVHAFLHLENARTPQEKSKARAVLVAPNSSICFPDNLLENIERENPLRDELYKTRSY